MKYFVVTVLVRRKVIPLRKFLIKKKILRRLEIGVIIIEYAFENEKNANRSEY